MPYSCLIPCSMQISRKFHADFTQTSMQNMLWNPCGIHAESIYALSMLDSMQHADFTQILLRLSCRLRRGISAESLRNPCGIFAESLQNLSMPYPCLIPCFIHNLRKFNADFTQTFIQNALRKICRILAESLRNPCRIYLCIITRKFDAHFHTECVAESLRIP